MNKNDIELTVGIPTYNGSDYIRNCIESIVNQLHQGDKYGVEILISDNASTDGTDKIVKQYIEKYPYLFRYYRNRNNLGGDRNVDNIFKKARGNFVWLMGDDDRIMSGMFKYVLKKIISNREMSIFSVNARVYNRELTEVWQEQVFEVEERVYTPQEYYDIVGASAALNSSIIVKKKLWPLGENVYEYAKPNWVSLYKIYSSLRDGKAYVIADVCVEYRGGSNRWHKNGKWLMMILDLCDTLDNVTTKLGYSKDITKRHIKDIFKTLLFVIVDAKKNDLVLSKELRFRLRYRFGKHISYWLKSYLLLYIPNFVIKRILSLKKRFLLLLRKRSLFR